MRRPHLFIFWDMHSSRSPVRQRKRLTVIIRLEAKILFNKSIRVLRECHHIFSMETTASEVWHRQIEGNTAGQRSFDNEGGHRDVRSSQSKQSFRIKEDMTAIDFADWNKKLMKKATGKHTGEHFAMQHEQHRDPSQPIFDLVRLFSNPKGNYLPFLETKTCSRSSCYTLCPNAESQVFTTHYAKSFRQFSPNLS